MKYDLHLHSVYSYDADAEVRTVFEAAAASGVDLIAVTDHHCMDGFREVEATAAEYPSVRCLAGMEATVETRAGAIDVVCLGFSADDADLLEKPVISKYREWMREHNAAVVTGCGRLGIPFDASDVEKLLAWRPGRLREIQGEVRVANSVLRDEFVRKGVLASPEDYGELMRRICEAAKSPPYPPAGEIMPFLAERAAVVSIAHPMGRLEHMGAEEFAGLVEEVCANGVEAGHARHSREQRDAYAGFCMERRLVATGGSDSHSKEEYSLGIGRHMGGDSWGKEVLDLAGPGAIRGK
ncbi:MAG: PHP domain-containing protein [Planctomycetes bacterium]|nr:PHP domain-containing protein [Planctomycetota bacterium]